MILAGKQRTSLTPHLGPRFQPKASVDVIQIFLLVRHTANMGQKGVNILSERNKSTWNDITSSGHTAGKLHFEVQCTALGTIFVYLGIIRVIDRDLVEVSLDSNMN